jgi:DNA-directed RNA polymerase I subunit RPA1
MLASSSIITRKMNNLVFGFLDPDEVRKLSVKEINKAKAFDQLNNPIKGTYAIFTVGGLYDPAMGVQPHDRGSRCVTCGQESFECTGHIGHVELLLPVYNPFLVNKLIVLLRYHHTSMS